jgi:NADPH2:quinone reductase
LTISKFKVGDRVHYMANLKAPNGGYAEYSIAESIAVTQIPDSVTFEEAAALPTAGWYSHNFPS